MGLHRAAGYASMGLYGVSLVGALMIARRAFGGGVDAQAWIVFVGVGVGVCFGLAVYNVRKLQIEQHRAWMLRGWFYVRMAGWKRGDGLANGFAQAGSIISARILMVVIATLTSNRDYHIVWSCAKIASTLLDQSLLVQGYPLCASYADGSNLDQVSPVSLDFSGSDANIGAALDVSFGVALWLAFNIHALGIEVYVSSRLIPCTCLADEKIAASYTPRGRAAENDELRSSASSWDAEPRVRGSYGR